jgi:anti-sigma regulatory factor (Ser/Thr protein kinase)
VRAQLARWGVGGEAAAAAEVVVGELTSNVVEHAGTPFHLAVSFDGSRVRVLVRDQSREPPRIQAVDHRATRGRGLQLVDGLCTRWDWMVHPDGKTVWALLPATPPG